MDSETGRGGALILLCFCAVILTPFVDTRNQAPIRVLDDLLCYNVGQRK